MELKRIVYTGLVALLLVSCGSGGDEPSITGDPPLEIEVNAIYKFTPVVDGFDSIDYFSIVNKPSWASFDSTDGSLTGLPTLADVGIFPDITISVSGTTGESSETVEKSLASFSITVTPSSNEPPVSISASSESGKVPMLVRFTPQVDIPGVINAYRWIIRGAKNYDFSKNTSAPLELVFDTAGDYSVVLTVTHNDGTEYISNELSIEVVGEDVGLSSLFKFYPATYATTQLQPIRFYLECPRGVDVDMLEWDLDGDGEYNADELIYAVTFGEGQPTFMYTVAGEYEPTVRITMSDGQVIQLYTQPLKIIVGGFLSAKANITTSSGEVVSGRHYVNSLGAKSFALSLDGIEMSDVAEIRWYQGESADLIGNSETINIDFQSKSIVPVSLEVETTSGKIIKNGFELALSDPKFEVVLDERSSSVIDPLDGNSVLISVMVEFDSEFSVSIEDENGKLIKKLREMGQGSSGQYSFSWDGKSDQGDYVPDGGYEVAVFYKSSNEVRKYEGKNFANVTEADTSTFDISMISTQETYSPFNNDPLDIYFTLDSSARVSVFAGLQEIQTAARSILNGVYLPPGEHHFYWHTTDDDDVFLELSSENKPQPGIWGYAPTSALIIVVKGAPTLSKVTSSPYVYNPINSKYGSNEPYAVSEFSIDRSADIVVRINDADSGKDVYTTRLTQQPAGVVTFRWNGKDNAGNLVRSGRYHYTFVGENEFGRSLPQNSLQQLWY